MSERRGPLSGLRILDFTRVLAGPFCTMILGDLGAEIIKIEDLAGGDQTRNIPPHVNGESHYFLAINRNKKSVALDARTPGGRAVLLDLVRECDAVVENFRPGVMARLGLGEAALRKVNPRVVICSISGYGQETSLSAKPSFDLVAQAMSGVMSINGEADGPPTKLGLPIGDLGGGVWAAIGILSALQHRNATGEALTIDLSLLDGLVGMLGYLGELYLLTGEVPTRVGSAHQSVVPYGRFPAKDGHIVIALMVESFWVKFCSAIGQPELCTGRALRDAFGAQAKSRRIGSASGGCAFGTDDGRVAGGIRCAGYSLLTSEHRGPSSTVARSYRAANDPHHRTSDRRSNSCCRFATAVRRQLCRHQHPAPAAARRTHRRGSDRIVALHARADRRPTSNRGHRQHVHVPHLSMIQVQWDCEPPSAIGTQAPASLECGFAIRSYCLLVKQVPPMRWKLRR